MPKVARNLTALEVKNLAHPGGTGNVFKLVGGVPGLGLQLLPSGGRTWLLRIVVGGRRREVGLGGFPEITLAAARERARQARSRVWEGYDPVEDRKARTAALVAARKRGLTFTEALSKFEAAKLAGHKDSDRWVSMLNIHAVPHLGGMLVHDITPQDILRVLNPIWSEKAETARKLRSRLEAVLSWATVAGHRTGDNPARWGGNLKELLPKQAAAVVNQPALSLADAPAWFAALQKLDGTGSRAVEFLTLTAVRSGEVRGAEWSEINGDMWIIPAERMKAGKEHRVPLCQRAQALLASLPRPDGNPLVFPAPRGGMLSDMTLSATMKRMHESAVKAGGKGWLDPRSGRPAVPHGLRSTFRDWSAEQGVDRDMAEIALAHNVGSEVERAYRRSDMVERRRAMMAEWSAFLGAV